MSISNFYKKNIKKINRSVECLFEICLFVVVFLGHKIDIQIVMYYYKIFYVLTVIFGIWMYTIKNQRIKDMTVDVLIKFSAPLIGAFIIAKITSKVDMSDIYPSLYIVPIIIITYLKNMKTGWRVNGKVENISSYEFLKKKIGIYALIPEISVYIVALIVAIFNGSTVQLISICVITEFLLRPMYVYILIKCRKNLINTN